MQATAMRPRNWFWSGEEPEWIVVATLAVALILGAVLMASVTGQATTTSVDGMSLSYPADWMQGSGEGVLLKVNELGSEASLTVQILRELDPANPVSMDDLVAQRGFDQTQRVKMYRVLSSEQAELGGKKAVAVTYAYVIDPAGSAYQSVLPMVIEGVDYIVPHNGKAYLITLETNAEDFAAHEKTFDRILKSVKFQ